MMSESSEYIIEVEDLALKTGEKYLLKDINWQVKAGEHWLVFGMNGSGKTTLLSILAGYKYKSRGKVQIFNQEYTEDNILAIRSRIGWVSASFFDQIYHDEAVRDIVLSGKFGTVGLDEGLDDEDYKYADRLLDSLNIADKAELPFRFLSKGERQNVLIARAFMGKSEILFLDEPCSGLDIIAREKFLHTIIALAREQNITIVYVTHYTEEILTDVFKQTLLLKDGLCYKQGLTEDIFTAEVLSSFLDQRVQVEKSQPYGYQVTLKEIAEKSVVSM